MSTPKAPRSQAPLTNLADGAIPAAQFERWRKSFESDAALLDEGERTEERLGTAFALWMGYPWLLELIGRNTSGRYLLRDQYKFEPDPASLPAYHALNHAHYLATNVLMAEAEINGLNPHPLLECGNVVRELFSREPWKYYVGCDVFWPACMGDARYSLPAGQQEAIRAGEEVFVRLALRPKIRSDAQAVLDAKAAEVAGVTTAQGTDDRDLAIVKFLAGKGTAQAQEDIAAEVGLDRKRVGERLVNLRVLRLTRKVKGKGEQVTDDGIAWADKLAPKSGQKRPT
jgi:hypothetical protein